MRVFVVAAVVAAFVGLPSVANADGGAYFGLDKTYYLAGNTAVANTYVAITKSKAALLDRGPFYAFVLADGVSLREGAPIPAAAVRVGVFTVTYEKGAYEFETRFTMPSLPPGWHTLRLCNDPCTIAGFREPLTGSFYVVETEREAALMIENGKLRGELAGARRDAAKGERALDGAHEDLRNADRDAADAAAEIDALQELLATAQADALGAQTRSETDRRLMWTAIAALIMLGTIGMIVRERRRRRTAATRPAAAEPPLVGPVDATPTLEEEELTRR